MKYIDFSDINIFRDTAIIQNFQTNVICSNSCGKIFKYMFDVRSVEKDVMRILFWIKFTAILKYAERYSKYTWENAKRSIVSLKKKLSSNN